MLSGVGEGDFTIEIPIPNEGEDVKLRKYVDEVFDRIHASTEKKDRGEIDKYQDMFDKIYDVISTKQSEKKSNLVITKEDYRSDPRKCIQDFIDLEKYSTELVTIFRDLGPDVEGMMIPEDELLEAMEEYDNVEIVDYKYLKKI